MRVISLSPPISPPKARVRVPGSKSYTNRALIMAALAPGLSRLHSASLSKDSEVLISALRSLGVSINPGDTGELVIEGRGPSLSPFHGTIDVGPAGTSMRFLTALCAGIPRADITLQGSDRMHERPIHDLVDALRQAGALIEYLGREGCPPVRIHSEHPLSGRKISIDGTTSSQFLSALLLTSPLFQDGLSISVRGRQISTSYLDMTTQSVMDFGVRVERSGYTHFKVEAGQNYSPCEYHIEGDASGASYLWAIAAISGGTVTVENINSRSAQGDIKFPELLAQMGCAVETHERSITVRGAERLLPIETDMSLMPDTAQTLAVVAAFAKGTTIIRGLSTLRVKETDRVAALHTELSKMGVLTEIGSDYIVIHGGSPHGATIATYEDHRMAMSFATAAAGIPNIHIEEPEVVVKSFPNFWEELSGVGILVGDL